MYCNQKGGRCGSKFMLTIETMIFFIAFQAKWNQKGRKKKTRDEG